MANVLLCWLPGKGMMKYTRNISAANKKIRPIANNQRFTK
jgi:hypothetical protein